MRNRQGPGCFRWTTQRIRIGARARRNPDVGEGGGEGRIGRHAEGHFVAAQASTALGEARQRHLESPLLSLGQAGQGRKEVDGAAAILSALHRQRHRRSRLADKQQIELQCALGLGQGGEIVPRGSARENAGWSEPGDFLSRVRMHEDPTARYAVSIA
jgi:hypothetical protein